MRKGTPQAHKLDFKNLPLIPLSKAIETVQYEDGKVSLVQKSISRIDQVSPKHQLITTLYLSGNFISELSCISQFPNLRILSLASNNLTNIQTLRNLTHLKSLQNLSLSGNPITQHPLYRIYTIGYCRNLKIFDNASIFHLHQESEALLAEFQQKFDKMMEGYWTMIKLCKFGKNIEVHRQVSRKGRCCGRERLTVWMRVCDLRGEWTEKAKEQVWNSLCEDCLLIYQTLTDNQKFSEGFMRAVDSMMDRQKQKIRELWAKLETKIERQQATQPDEQVSDEELFSQISSKITGTLKSTKYRELSLKLGGFLALKHHKQTSHKHRQRFQTNIDIGCQLLSGLLLGVKIDFMGKLKKYAEYQGQLQRRSPSPAFKHKVAALQRSIVKKTLWKLKEKLSVKKVIQLGCQSRSRRRVHDDYQYICAEKQRIVRQKRQRRQLLKKYICIWRDEHQKKEIERSTKQLCVTFQQMKTKQSKYQTKIQLLHEYVEIIKSQHEKDRNELKRSRQYHSRQILIKDDSRRTHRMTYDNTPSPRDEYSPKATRIRQKSSPSPRQRRHQNQPHRIPLCSVQQQYFTHLNVNSNVHLNSSSKQNQQQYGNLGKTRQRILNRRDEFEDIHCTYQGRRKEIMSRIQKLDS